MVKAAEALSNIAVAIVRRVRPTRKHVRYGVWFTVIWVAYVVGAIGGTIALGRLGMASVGAAVAAIAAVAAFDLVSPAEFDHDVAPLST